MWFIYLKYIYIYIYIYIYANTAKRIEILLGVENPGDPRNTVLDGDPNFLCRLDAAFAKLLWSLVIRMLISACALQSPQFVSARFR